MDKDKFIYAVLFGDLAFKEQYGNQAGFYAEKNFGIKNSEEIKRVRSLITPERIEGFGSKELFVSWYYDEYFAKKEQGIEPTCAYCGVTEKDCKKYLFEEKHTKRDKTRSQHLEVERKEANGLYRQDNCILACYVCNNAKSDFMSLENFRPTARAINFFWRRVLQKKIPFPIDTWKPKK